MILDVVMPKLDGSRVCWLVRRDPTLRETPIIVFSSLGVQGFRHFPNLSADAYVAKGKLAAEAHLVVRSGLRFTALTGAQHATVADSLQYLATALQPIA